MVALAKITKAELAAEARKAYIAYELEHLYISGDDRGAFAVVQSQSQDIVYKVYFVEPCNAASHAISCECDGFYYRKHCVHTEIVNQYHARIHAIVNHPIDISFEAYVAALEDIYNVAELSPKKAKKVRRSAPQVELITELQQIHKGKKVRMRKGGLVVKCPVVEVVVSPDCPAVVTQMAA